MNSLQFLLKLQMSHLGFKFEFSLVKEFNVVY